MGKYFTLSELSVSMTAAAHGIDNIPGGEAMNNMEALIDECLDPIRELWGRRLIVNSGYRSPKVNALVGGVKTSQHLKGEAADITTTSSKDNITLYELIKRSAIPFDQLILEAGANWIHVSYSHKHNRHQIIDNR